MLTQLCPSKHNTLHTVKDNSLQWNSSVQFNCHYCSHHMYLIDLVLGRTTFTISRSIPVDCWKAVVCRVSSEMQQCVRGLDTTRYGSDRTLARGQLQREVVLTHIHDVWVMRDQTQCCSHQGFLGSLQKGGKCLDFIDRPCWMILPKVN